MKIEIEVLEWYEVIWSEEYVVNHQTLGSYKDKCPCTKLFVDKIDATSYADSIVGKPEIKNVVLRHCKEWTQ